MKYCIHYLIVSIVFWIELMAGLDIAIFVNS